MFLSVLSALVVCILLTCDARKHMGSVRYEIERDLLINKAQEWIWKIYLAVKSVPEQKQNVLIVERSECVRVTHDFAYQFFLSCLVECQLTYLLPLLHDLETRPIYHQKEDAIR